MNIYKLLQAELQLHNDLRDKVLKIVKGRCNTGYGRVQRGALLAYIYYHLGFHGRIGNDFSRYFTKVLEEDGYRCSYYSGKRIYVGLSWRDEKKENWRRPLADDLPKFNGNFYILEPK